MGSGKTHTLKWMWRGGYFPLHAFVQACDLMGSVRVTGRLNSYRVWPWVLLQVDPDRVRGVLPELRIYLEQCPEVGGVEVALSTCVCMLTDMEPCVMYTDGRAAHAQGGGACGGDPDPGGAGAEQERGYRRHPAGRHVVHTVHTGARLPAYTFYIGYI